jgi:hypothetical protein
VTDPFHELNRSLGRVEQKLDDLVELHIKQTDKISELESWKDRANQKIAWVSGAFAVFATAASYGLKHIISLIS